MRPNLLWLLLTFLSFVIQKFSTVVANDYLHLANCTVPMCTGPLSAIYCSGELVATTWKYGLQKHCPGSKMRKPPREILANFAQLPATLSNSDFLAFCKNNFQDADYLEMAELSDWMENPPILAKINDENLRLFAQKVHGIWKELARKFKPDVLINTEFYPVLPVDNPFIAPGRDYFQIYFYWDSFWIAKGLLFSNMTSTVAGIIKNFIQVINEHGFIPNSGDIRLSRRSQFPVFTQIVADYYTATCDKKLLYETLPYIERELAWWETNRTVIVDGMQLFQYKAITNCPRPENYETDYKNGINSTNSRQFTWSSIASACESGWDFSSRWFAYHGLKAGTKNSIRTNVIVPVDLNAIMSLNYLTMARFHRLLKDENKGAHFAEKHRQLYRAINAVFWNDTVGVWLDFDLQLRMHRMKFYPSNVFPLLAGVYSTEKLTKIIDYLDESKVLRFKGGLPASYEHSGQQWDYPNGWAPIVHMFIESLHQSGHSMLCQIAVEIAKKFITTVYNGLMHPVDGDKVSSGLWEKYDVRYDDGRPGSGGEYPVQVGFGWTNGAVLDLLAKFGNNVNLNVEKKAQTQRVQHGDGNANRLAVIVLLIFCLFVIASFSIHHLRIHRNSQKKSLVEFDQMGINDEFEAQRLLLENDEENLLEN